MDTATLTPKQQRLHELVEAPRVRARWAPRSRRRTLVAALVGTILLSAAVFTVAVLTDGPAAFALLAGFVVLGILTICLGSHIGVAARWLPGYPGLDEFQRAEMDQAALRGHSLTRILLTVLVTVTCALGGAMLSVDLPGTAVLAILLPLVLLTTFCHASFPAAYLAWTRPDELPDEEDSLV